jgi:Predicted AAA-ATPase/PD-(D/E)XK nuclease superfamily
MKKHQLIVPYGRANFESIRRMGFYYVDKTAYIEHLEEASAAPIFLRPRRFGKSLWCSTLAAYYDVKMHDHFEELFGDLHVGKHPTDERNSYMVMRFNFSQITTSTNHEQMQEEFHNYCQTMIEEFLQRYESYFAEKDYPISKFDLTRSSHLILNKIGTLSQSLNLPKIYVIIDEYDNFTNHLVLNYRDDLYREITKSQDSYFKVFFKTIKALMESGAIGRVFFTGILPITLDDIGSGFNIGTLEGFNRNLLPLCGFTEGELREYLRCILKTYELGMEREEELISLLKIYYNGYIFKPNYPSLYNPTIVGYFFKEFIKNKGEYPESLFDNNLRVELNWLIRLAPTPTILPEMVQRMMESGLVAGTVGMLQTSFRLEDFEKTYFFPSTLYHLGLLTWSDQQNRLAAPNLSIKQIYAEWHRTLQNVPIESDESVYFRELYANFNLQTVFDHFWNYLLNTFPAQSFNNMRENFFQLMFYDLCHRNIETHFLFNVETNLPKGRCDFELWGRPNTTWQDHHWIVEMKHFGKSEREKIVHLTEPQAVHREQAQGYAASIQQKYPNQTMHVAVLYIVSNDSYRWFDVSIA